MSVAPTKIIFVVIFSSEVALVSSSNIIIVLKEVNKEVQGKICNCTINKNHSNKK